jgi:hypothetical protein
LLESRKLCAIGTISPPMCESQAYSLLIEQLIDNQVLSYAVIIIPENRVGDRARAASTPDFGLYY